MNALRTLALAGAASLALCALPAPAAPITGILNGSFEETTTPAWNYWGAGTYATAVSWTSLGWSDSAGSLATGLETLTATDGTRLLRLSTDNSSIGRTAQHLGTMVAGETYTFRADVIASALYGPYGATAAFVNEATAVPTTVYATQTVNVAQGATGGFILSYTATAPDNGQDLYIWLESVPQTQNYSRGGIDRARLDGQPQPPAVPSAPSPANGAGIAGVSTTLTWASDPLAISYQLFLWPVGESKPATATATLSDPTYSPGTLLQGLTYQWQVVAVNAVGTTPGPVWTFTTGVIPFTYVYEADSAPPNVPAELSAPYMLNDGLIGTGWDAMTQLYSLPPSYAYPVPKIPYVTLTLAANSGMQKLTVWYTRAITAGIAEPASVTVTDDSAHSTTVTFTARSSNGVFSQDVDLAGMVGTVLHVNFTSTREWVGLDEIRVFEPSAPAVPTAPSPATGGSIAGVASTLTWASDTLATSYRVFLWPASGSKPGTATATPSSATYSASGLLPETAYQWQVEAVNAVGTTPGPVWTFTTGVAGAISFTYIYQADSVQPGNPELSTPSMLNDGVFGTSWQDGSVMYGSTAQSSVQPHIKLTLGANAGLGKLTVWYSRGSLAGVLVPHSVTVSDGFGHLSTTVFTVPPGNDNGYDPRNPGVFSQDVSLAGMVGTELDLSFATAEPAWLALNEIQMFEPAALPPETPVIPVPSNGSIAVPVTTSLGWNASVGATSYDVYFWNSLDAEPLTATATVTANSWTPAAGLISATEASYSWKVVAKNVHGDAPGAVWGFTTSVFPYTYTYDDESAMPENYGGGYGETRATPCLLNDGQTGGQWAGGGLVLYSGNDYLAQPAAYAPAITLTLGQAPGAYQALRIWHFGGGAAGVHAPASLTVTDNYGHSTTFTEFPDVEPTSTDVPITNMQGTILHLRFGPQTGSVGISEIKVYGTALVASPYDLWAKNHAGEQSAEMDFDHDGVPNGVEYFMDAPDGFTENPGVVNGTVTWSRVNPVTSFEVQVSDSLTGWVPAEAADVDLSDPNQVIYTFPKDGSKKKFCRFAVTP